MAARLAIARAQRQLSDEAGVHLHIREFAVINTVGAVSLRATLNCEAFADAHRSESHFDRSSFVGLAWRPAGEACCVGALPTNSNLHISPLPHTRILPAHESRRTNSGATSIHPCPWLRAHTHHC